MVQHLPKAARETFVSVYTSRAQLIIKGSHGFLIQSTRAFLYSPRVPFLTWPMHTFSYMTHACLLLYSPWVPSLTRSTRAFSYTVHACPFLHGPHVPFLTQPTCTFPYTTQVHLSLYNPRVPFLIQPMRTFSGNSTAHSEQSPFISVKIHDNLPRCTHSTI